MEQDNMIAGIVSLIGSSIIILIIVGIFFFVDWNRPEAGASSGYHGMELAWREACGKVAQKNIDDFFDSLGDDKYHPDHYFETQQMYKEVEEKMRRCFERWND